MTSTTEQAPVAVLRRTATASTLSRLAAPTIAAVLVPAALAVTGVLLWVAWPLGVAIGIAACTVAVLAAGIAMQRSARAVPVSTELEQELGIAPRTAAAPSRGVDATAAAGGAALPAPSADATEPATPEAMASEPAAPEAVAPESARPAEPAPAAGPPTAVVPTRAAVAAPAPDAPAPVEPPTAAPAAVEPLAAAVAPAAETGPAETGPVAPAAGAGPADEAPDVLIAGTFEVDPELDEEPIDAGVREDLARLRAELGDDYHDFTRAAHLVVETQYASAARLQRDLGVPYSRARRLLSGLETEHFVGPPTGTLPRQVMVPRERLADVERLFAEA